MKILSKQIEVSAFKLIVILSIIILFFLCYLYFVPSKISFDDKLNSLVGGLLAGCAVGLVQLFLSWYEFKTIDKFERMQIFDVRTNRDNREFYEEIIKEANKNIYVMGVTADRFIEHFADLQSNQPNAKVLLEAMSQRGVKVRILLPREDYLDSTRLINTAHQVELLLSNLKNVYPNNFEFKYFLHAPAHSIFVVDNKCIIGPVLPGLSSKDTPAIFLDKHSAFAEPYLNYFETEWVNAV